MKKLLTLLLLFPLLASCSSDDDDTVYLDNKLIEGSWYWIQASDSTVYTFKDDVVRSKLVDKYTLVSRDERNAGSYKLTTDAIIYNKSGNSQKYILKNDTLFLYFNDGFIKYIKAK